MRHTNRAVACRAGRGGIVWMALIGVAVLCTPALAKPKPAPAKRIAVLPPTDGTRKEAIISAKIAKALKPHKILAVTGGPVKKAVSEGVPSSDADWIALARQLRVDGLVEPTMSGKGAKRRVEVVVHNGADGSVAGRETFAAKGRPAKLAAAVAAGLWKKLGSAIKETTPPKKDEDSAKAVAQTPSSSEPTAGEKPEEAAAQTPSSSEPTAGEKPEEAAAPGHEGAETMPILPEEKSEAAEEPAKATSAKKSPEEEEEMPHGRDRSARRPRVLEVEIGGRALQRVFEYTPASAGASYVENFLPVVEGRVSWFPILYAGVFATGEFNYALTSGSNPAFPTGTNELVLGGQGRYPLSRGVLGLSVAYFQHLFVIGDTSDPNDTQRQSLAWPDTAYQGARLAASGRFYLWSFLQVGAEAGYRLVTNPGQGGLRVQSSHYFPNGKASYGLEGSAFVSVGVVSWLEIRGGVDYRRYVFGALAPGPDNANGTNAGGAIDEYLGFTLGVVGVYGGK